MPRLRAFRAASGVLALACALFLAFAVLGGGLHRDASGERLLTAGFALAALAGAGLAQLPRSRLGALVLGATAAAGVAWDVAVDLGVGGTWWLWAALAVAGGLAWRTASEAGP